MGKPEGSAVDMKTTGELVFRTRAPVEGGADHEKQKQQAGPGRPGEEDPKGDAVRDKGCGPCPASLVPAVPPVLAPGHW